MTIKYGPMPLQQPKKVLMQREFLTKIVPLMCIIAKLELVLRAHQKQK